MELTLRLSGLGNLGLPPAWDNADGCGWFFAKYTSTILRIQITYQCQILTLRGEGMLGCLTRPIKWGVV